MVSVVTFDALTIGVYVNLSNRFVLNNIRTVRRIKRNFTYDPRHADANALVASFSSSLKKTSR